MLTKESNGTFKERECNDVTFDLLCTYGSIVESNSIIIENDPRDTYRYSLYNVLKPFPTFDEYQKGEEFEEGDVIGHAKTLDEITVIQKEQKVKTAQPVLTQ